MALAPTRRLVAALCGLALLALLVVVFPAFVWLGWAAALLLISLAGLDARGSLLEPPVVAARSLPERAGRGPVLVRYRIQNTTRRTLTVRLLDELPDDLGGDLELQVELDAGAHCEAERTLLARRRGLRPLGPTYALVRSAVGFFERRTATRAGAALPVVVDGGLRLGRAPQAASMHSELGSKSRRQRGEGMEFESIRAYTPGDEPRAIDWRATARAGRVMVRHYQVERNHTLIIAVDTGRLMSTRIEGQSKLDHALDASVALAGAARRAGDRVAFLAFDQAVRVWLPPLSAHRRVGALLEATLPLEPRTVEPSYATLAETLRTRHAKRALLVLMTDFVEGATSPDLERYLAVLARRHCVLLVALRDALLDELRLPAPDIPGEDIYRRLVLQDLEVERRIVLRQIERLGVHTLDLSPSQIRAPVLARYLEIREAGL